MFLPHYLPNTKNASQHIIAASITPSENAGFPFTPLFFQPAMQPANLSQNIIQIFLLRWLRPYPLQLQFLLYQRGKKKEKLKEERDDFTSLLNDHKIFLQVAKHDVLNKQDLMTAHCSTVTCLQESQPKLLAENKTITVLSVKIMRKSK